MCIVFDLDDTLYKEIDFVMSGFRYIAGEIKSDCCSEDAIFNVLKQSYLNGENAFDELETQLGTTVSKERLLSLYRNHFPSIKLPESSRRTLGILIKKGCAIGLLTDGRSLTQRNKIGALGLWEFISERNVIISEEIGSEKPSRKSYQYFMELHPACKNFIYVGDNPSKDFLAPNQLGWLTVGVKDDGNNIHKQKCSGAAYTPRIWIENIREITDIISLNR